MLQKLKIESENAGMRLNLKKTKIMTTGNLNKFKLDGTEIEIIDSYTFLGTIITEQRNKQTNIKRDTGDDKTRENYEGSGRDGKHQI